MRQVLYVLVGVVGGFALAGAIFLLSRSDAGQSVVLEAAPTQPPLQVHVIGAVLRPGLYAFVEGSRVQDAVTAAGGLTADADLTGINLAAKLEDGQQLSIPGGGGGGAAQPAATSGFRVLPSGEATATPSGDLVNINTASADLLATLPGIGPTTAQRIVDYRTENGPFARDRGSAQRGGHRPGDLRQHQHTDHGVGADAPIKVTAHAQAWAVFVVLFSGLRHVLGQDLAGCLPLILRHEELHTTQAIHCDRVGVHAHGFLEQLHLDAFGFQVTAYEVCLEPTGYFREQLPRQFGHIALPVQARRPAS